MHLRNSLSKTSGVKVKSYLEKNRSRAANMTPKSHKGSLNGLPRASCSTTFDHKDAKAVKKKRMIFSSKLYYKKHFKEEEKSHSRFKATKTRLPYINSSERSPDGKSKKAWGTTKSKEAPKRSYPKIRSSDSVSHNNSKFILLKVRLFLNHLVVKVSSRISQIFQIPI